MRSAPDFPGRARLIQAIDHIHESGFNPERLCCALEDLHRTGGIALPAAVLSPRPDRYTRRQLHACPRWGYELIVMTWGPGHGSPLHDHDGHWCVECLWHGALEITRYDPCENDADGRMRFARQTRTRARAGQGAWLDSSSQYHTMRNPDPAEVAVSLHVYPLSFRRSGWFEPAADGWHQQRRIGEVTLDEWDQTIEANDLPPSPADAV